MKTLICTLLTLISFSVFAQGNYEKAMGEALQAWKDGKVKEASAQFERIAQVEKDNLIPKYYQSLTLVTNSFQIKDETEKADVIKKNEEIIPIEKKDII